MINYYYWFSCFSYCDDKNIKIRGFYDEGEIIKVITGVRRCGKSSLLEMIVTELREKGISDENIVEIHLDKRPYKRIRTVEALEAVIWRSAL